MGGNLERFLELLYVQVYTNCMCMNMQYKSIDTVDREIFVLKIIRTLKFHGAKFS